MEQHKQKCTGCDEIIDTTGLPISSEIWCGKCGKGPSLKGCITDPDEIKEALNDDPLFGIGYKSPFI